MLTYQVIKKDVGSLIECLEDIQSKFLPLNHNARKSFYLDIRKEFNENLVDFNYEDYSKHISLRNTVLDDIRYGM